MTKTCPNCQKNFEITEEDQSRYFNFQVPAPTLCPDCRQQRRAAQGNHIYLYKRKCNFSGKDIISNYHPSSPYKVYDQNIWFSDKWDSLSYGRFYDFNRPFFEQFKELSLAVPRPSLSRGYQYDENSDYTNYAGKNKNCYMIFDSDESRDCYYCYSINHGESCMDCYRVRTGELLYECVDCNECYNCSYCQDSVNCADSFFLKNCIGCKKCLMCSNLNNKEYYIKNQPSTKEQYESTLKFLHSYGDIQIAIKMFDELKLNYPQRFYHGVQNENVTGDYLSNCKNAELCFDSASLWDCKYVNQAFNPLKDCMDIQECGDGERLYECAFSGYDNFNLRFCIHCLGNANDLQYCNYCPHNSNLFGCIGLRHKNYCILNKQYKKEEYEELVSRIIKIMLETGEYGEFFPIALSSFAYNETLAQDHYPLTKEQAQAKGYNWQDELIQPQGSAKIDFKIPETIEETPRDISNYVLICSECGKNYKITDAEFRLLKSCRIPVPHHCFVCRHKRRRAMRNPRKIYSRQCMKCGTDIKTSYAENRPETVYCEKCYLDSIV